VTEDNAEDVRASPPAVGQQQRSAAAEIDLGFFAGTALEATEGQLQGLFQVADKATHAVVTAGEAMLGHQVLMNALGRQAEVELGLDSGAPGFAVTGAAGAGGSWPGGAGGIWGSALLEPMGAMAGFAGTGTCRRERATVSRSMPR
jgi:hypothetical protein